MNLNDLARKTYEIHFARGWWDARKFAPRELVQASKMLMMHAELSEMVEAHRTDAMDSHLPHRRGVEVEMVDLLIRAFELAGEMNLDLDGAWAEKEEYNARRRDHDRDARAVKGGKRY